MRVPNLPICLFWLAKWTEPKRSIGGLATQISCTFPCPYRFLAPFHVLTLHQEQDAEVCNCRSRQGRSSPAHSGDGAFYMILRLDGQGVSHLFCFGRHDLQKPKTNLKERFKERLCEDDGTQNEEGKEPPSIWKYVHCSPKGPTVSLVPLDRFGKKATCDHCTVYNGKFRLIDYVSGYDIIAMVSGIVLPCGCCHAGVFGLPAKSRYSSQDVGN